MNRRAFSLLLLFIGSIGMSRSLAVHGAEVVDPDLPHSFDPSALAALVQQSPFNRVVSFEETYLLTGIAHVEGKPLATLVNKETKQRFVVGAEPNAQGWRLAEASTTPDVHAAAVKILFGDEEVYLHYTDILKQPDKGPSSSRRREVTPVDIHRLAESDYIRKDENGKAYVRGSIYLPTADRDYYYNEMSSAARDQFRQVIRDSRDKMFSYSPDQRASFAKQAFDKAVADDRAGRLK